MMPQHFQQQAFWHHHCDEWVARIASANPWGIYRVRFDKEALSVGRLKLTALQARLIDGTVVDTDVADWIPPSRNLGDISSPTEVVVSIGLPMYDIQGNCAGDDQPSRPRRFVREDLHVLDMHGETAEEMAVERHALSLLFEFEPNGDYVTCPIARLVRNSQGCFELDRDFVPPCLVISASDLLMERTSRLSEMLKAKSLSLAIHRKERVEQIADYSVADVGLLWLLHCVNTAWPDVEGLNKAPDQHPERLYAVLARLACALSTFSMRETVLSIPPYTHETQGAVFETLELLIRNLLDAVVPSSVVPIALERLRPALWSGQIHDERLVEGADYYLAIRTALPVYDALEQLRRLCKVGAPDDVQMIVNSALSGVPLQPAQRLPVAMPVRADSHYFALDTKHPAFKKMMDARACHLYVPTSVPDVSPELYVVLPA